MPSGNWSFPCSPRNPAKVREELRLLAGLVATWRERGQVWSPRSGAQLEFGRRLRLMADGGGGRADDAETLTDAGQSLGASEAALAALRFQTQTMALSEDNLRWTARARYGTYKFFGFVATDDAGYAGLTPAGERFVAASRPGEVLLRQLLKWQYPDSQHHGRRWPAEDFAIFPFVATARLIWELGGLTRQEIGLFCFTMRRTEEAAATAEAIRQFRERQRRSTGRTGKARSARGTLVAAQARYAAEGRRVVLGSTDDYADAFIRYCRYTGLFSVRGPRIVVAGGRERDLEELIFDTPADGTLLTPGAGSAPPRPLQLALGEAPPVRLAAPRALFPDYEDSAAFYRHYGDAARPRLPWENPQRLAEIARSLDATVAELQAREARQRTGRTVLAGPTLGEHLPEDYASLVEVVDGLRRRRFRLERAIDAATAATPRHLAESLDFYRTVLAREVIDPPTFLEWNTWRVFLALGDAREVLPHLALDEDLQPLNTAPGGLPDLEVVYGSYRLVVEVTMRTGADQRQAEARPVTRHILEAQRRAADSAGGVPVYGLFVAPRLHVDTVTDFLVALKYRVIERQQINAIPFTVRQLVATLRPFSGQGGAGAEGLPFASERLGDLLRACVDAALASETGEDWLAGIEAAQRRWLAAIGARTAPPEMGARPLPLPLF
jgi:hypothetical protein